MNNFLQPLDKIKYLIYPTNKILGEILIQRYKLQSSECFILPKKIIGNVVTLPETLNNISTFNMLHLRWLQSGNYLHPLKLKHPEKFLLGGKCVTCGASELEQKAFPTCGIYQEKVQKLLLDFAELQLNPIKERII